MTTLPSLHPVFAAFSAEAKRQLDIQAGLKIRATLGVAPVGAEVLSWDRCEDEFGGYERIEFFVIPDEAVAPFMSLDETNGLDTLLNWLETADETGVVEFTISFGEGSFMAYGWHRASEALPAILRGARGEF